MFTLSVLTGGGYMPSFSFRLTDCEDDRVIEEVLSGLKGRERSSFIRRALFFYIKYEDKIAKIESGIEKILKKLDGAALITEKAAESEKKTEEGEQILVESINDIINL